MIIYASSYNNPLLYALGSLKAAEILISDNQYFARASLFHARQSAENALKIYLSSNGHKTQEKHDFIKLLLFCQTYDKSFKAIKPEIEFLAPFDCRILYPDSGFIDPLKTSAAIGLKHATTIYNFVASKIL